jgi:hypothetical protein
MVAAIAVALCGGVLASPAAAVVPAGNLVGDPGAEQGAATSSDTTVASPPAPWSNGGTNVTQVAYGAPGGFPTVGDSNAIAGGAAFFAGGPNTSAGFITQLINVTPTATEIDAGHIQATVSAALGGYANQNDTAQVRYTFKATSSSGDDGLDGTLLGPVTRSDRGDVTKLLVRDAAVSVPPGTRFITVELDTAREGSAPAGTYNDGYADNISITLRDTSVLPTNTSKPGMFGTPKPPNALTCSQGNWTASPTSYDFVWDRAPRSTTADSDPAWHAIDNATSAVYLVQQADVGSRVRCHVIAHNGAGMGEAVSRSLRVDLAAPVNATAPQVLGTPISQSNTLTCTTGEWSAGPEFTYQWLRDSQPIAGATSSTYTPAPTFNPSGPNFVNGDGNHQISCQVTATNDLGSAAATSAAVLVVDGPPRLTGDVTSSLDLSSPKPTGRKAACQTGTWADDYAALGTPAYTYEYQWLREDQPIPGATASTYSTTVEDLGRRIACRVTNTNPAGSRSAGSNGMLVPLPAGISDGTIYRAGGGLDGGNRYNPVNLMALSGEYTRAIGGLIAERSQKAVTAETSACRGRSGIATTAPSPGSLKFPVSDKTRCAILLHDATRVAVGGFGVQYNTGTCLLGKCPSLGFELAPIDPSRPPALDLELAARLAPVTPLRVLWDLNGDGHTDAECPGSAPVLRTMLLPGEWSVRAVIVSADSEPTGLYGSALQTFRHPQATNTFKGQLRASQPFVCKTSIDPPPDPETGPCVTEATIGRVRLSGNLCPINLRRIDDKDIEALPSDLKALIDAQGDQLGLDHSRTRYAAPEPFAAGRAFANVAAVDKTTAAAYTNTSAAITSFGAGSPPAALPKSLNEKLGDIPKFDVAKAQFALDQIYVSNGPMKVNGVTVDPLGDTAALMVPSDVGEALSTVKEMTVLARDAASSLGDIPLAAGGQLKAELPDLPKAPDGLLRQTNLDQLKQQLSDKLKGSLNLGPFELAGTADVKLQEDGTATLKAKAVLPFLRLSPGGPPISVDITIRGDLQGNVKLEGIKVGPVDAFLGGVKLEGLVIAYDSGGLSLQGSLLFPPVNDGLRINSFRLGPKGEFGELSVDYLAGTGKGISVGPGIFLTKLGGGVHMRPVAATDSLDANATVSVGPSTGGGCPTVGVNARLNVNFAPGGFFVDATGQVQLVCIPLVDIKFHADDSGLVTLDGRWDLSLGPVFIKGNIGVAVKLPNWMAEANVEGGVRDVPILGDVDVGVHVVLSNRGLAGCVSTFLGSGGAAVRFSNGRPPLTLPELIANIELFTGCDLKEFRTVGRRVASGAAAGSSSFAIPAGSRGVAVSLEGAGDAPRVTLRSPKGQVLDFTAAVDGRQIGNAYGTILEQEDRTVVLLKAPEAGTWTAEVAPGSPSIVRTRVAQVLAPAKVTGRVTGAGASRLLTYTVAPQDGQVVRLVEKASGASTVLRTVKGGGKGSIRFVTSEARSTRREIVAQVEQDGLPRETISVARFSAPNPTVGRPGRVRVRRSGTRAIVTWTAAALAKRYEVVTRSGDGGRMVLSPKPGARTVTVPQIAKGEGLIVGVTAISATGRRGKAGTARLAGSLQVGAQKKPKKPKKKK